VVTPPEVEVPASGFFWKVSFFTIFVSLAVFAYYYYQKHFGKKQVRKPRKWETIRNEVMRNQNYGGEQIPDYRNLESGYGNYQRHQHSIDNEVPLSSYQASTWERMSKGNKFV
jgi:hypothetical protein